MNTDYRIKVGFFRHHKTKRLQHRLGFSGVIALLRLWEYASEFRFDGNLSGMSGEDIELVVDWSEEKPLVAVLLEVGFLDCEDNEYCLHDWQEHNPWISVSEDRSALGRLSRLFRKNKEAAQVFKDQGRTGITKEEYQQAVSGDRSTNVVRTQYERSTNAQATAVAPTPAPAPAPAPAPKEVKNTYAPSCDKTPSHSVPEAEPNQVPPHKRVTLDPTTYQWHGITQADLDALSSAYPACCVSTELLRAAEWVKANPAKRKSNWYRFIVNWLRNAQDRGGGKLSNAVQQDATGGWIALVEKRNREQQTEEGCVNDSARIQ